MFCILKKHRNFGSNILDVRGTSFQRKRLILATVARMIGGRMIYDKINFIRYIVAP